MKHTKKFRLEFTVEENGEGTKKAPRKPSKFEKQKLWWSIAGVFVGIAAIISRFIS